MNDTELLEEFRVKRSEQAFAALLRRYAALVYSVARRRLSDSALAEDVTQLVFIRFAKTPPQAQNQSQLLGWLHRTATNVAVDLWRSETRRHARETKAAAMEPSSSSELWQQIAPDLDQALDELEEEHRQAILLRFFADKTMREVGLSLGISEDAAKMRVNRAVERLRTRLSPGGSCAAVTLAALLAEHSVQAAPVVLIDRLSGLRLPAGSPGATLHPALLKAGIGLSLLGLIVLSVMYLPGLSKAPATASDSDTPQLADRERGTFSSVPATVRSEATEIQTRPVRTVFHVRDSETGAALARAKIHYAYFGLSGEGERTDTTTDSNGNAFILDPEDPGKSGPNVFVVADGRVPKVVMLGNPVVEDYTIHLDPGMEIKGWVVDEAGITVSDVRIYIQGSGIVQRPGEEKQIEHVDFQTCPVSSQEDGSWACNYIPRDYTNEIRLKLKKAGYAITFPVIPVAQVDLSRLVLVINQDFTISGQIMDAQHRPIAQAKVKTLQWNLEERQSALTDENGWFTLPGVPADRTPNLNMQSPPVTTTLGGEFVIRGLAPVTRDHPDTVRRIEVLQAEGQAELERLRETLRLLNQIPSEQLAEETQIRLPDALLGSLLDELAIQEEQVSTQPREQTLTAVRDLKEKIRLRVGGVLKGSESRVRTLETALNDLQRSKESGFKPAALSADLALEAKGYACQTVTVQLTTKTNEVHFVMSPGNILQGIVVDEEGNPLSGVFIRTDMNFEKQIQTRFDWKSRTDGSGRFLWDSAPAEETCYWFAAEGYASIRGLALEANGTDHRIVLKKRRSF